MTWHCLLPGSLRLKALAHWAEQAPITHLTALGAEFEVSGPFVMSFRPNFSSVTVAALDAVFAAESMQL